MNQRQHCKDGNGHVWSHEYGKDWVPKRGTPCDCGEQRWGYPYRVIEALGVTVAEEIRTKEGH